VPRRLVIGTAVAAVAVAVVVMLVSRSSNGGPSPVSMSPRALESLALADAVHGGWVHEVIRTVGPGHVFVGNDEIGTSSGRQTWANNGWRSEVVIAHGVAYIRGNAAALVHFFQIPAAHPQLLANRWLLIPRAVPDYRAVSAGVTLASDFSQYKCSAPFAKGAVTTLHGLRVIPIRCYTGRVPVTLYVTASAPVLPIESHVVEGKVESTISWTGWGSPGGVAAPPSAIPITAVLGSP
jgi:hypothetical protein